MLHRGHLRQGAQAPDTQNSGRAHHVHLQQKILDRTNGRGLWGAADLNEVVFQCVVLFPSNTRATRRWYCDLEFRTAFRDESPVFLRIAACQIAASAEGQTTNEQSVFNLMGVPA